jgi:hypothetical protein
LQAQLLLLQLLLLLPSAGVFDLRPALVGAAGGGVLNPRQLSTTAVCLLTLLLLLQVCLTCGQR